MGTSNCSAVFEGVIWSIFYRSEKVPEFKKLKKLLDSYDDFELNGWTFKLECSFSDVVEDKLCGSMFCAVKEDFGVDLSTLIRWKLLGVMLILLLLEVLIL
jgi:hypothetical protein